MYRIETPNVIFASLGGAHSSYILFGAGFTTDVAALENARALGYRTSEVSGAAVPVKYELHRDRLDAWPHQIGVIEVDETDPGRPPMFASFHGRTFDLRDVLDGKVTADDALAPTV